MTESQGHEIVYKDLGKSRFTQATLEVLFDAIGDDASLLKVFGNNFLGHDWILRHDIEDNVVIPYVMIIHPREGTVMCRNITKVFFNEQVTIFSRGETYYFFTTNLEREEKDFHDRISYR